MKRRRVFGIVSFAIVTTLVMVSQPVLAAWVVVAQGKGITWVNNGGCDATVWGGATGNPVWVGDNIVFLYYVWWWDNRTGAEGSAVHNFTMIVTYSRLSGDLYAWTEPRTDGGGAFGSRVLNITIYNVQSPSTIRVDWIASVNSPDNPVCFAQDSTYAMFNI